ncbi:MAG TPA: hypothetical protein VLC54_09930, partial [Anaeromyxobacter sp.]|nr:hypothetical protein [Anaeromyxobacter sp.]
FTADFTPDLEETWTATLVVTDGVNTTIGSASYVCVNDAPLPDAGETRYGNLGQTSAETTPIPLVGTALDINADAPLDYIWSLDAKPAASALVVGTTIGSASTAQFVPDVEGQYVLRLRASDPQGAAGSDTVIVEAHRHIRDLGHDVDDAEYARNAGVIVMVGHDPANSAKGMLWTLDLATGTETPVPLETSPTSVSVSVDGTRAAVADDVYVRRVSLGATPTVASEIAPFSVRDVAIVGSSDAYLFPYYEPYATTQPHIRAYDLANGGLTETYKYGNAGVGDPVLANVLYAADDQWGELTRYTTSGRGTLGQTHADYDYSCPGGRIWAAENGGHVFSSCGSIHVASTLEKLLKSLPYGIQHLHSAATSGEVVLLSGTAASLQRFSASFDAVSSEALPYWGLAGNGSASTGRFAFISADGKIRWAIVRANVAGVWKTGLVTFTSP